MMRECGFIRTPKSSTIRNFPRSILTLCCAAMGSNFAAAFKFARLRSVTTAALFNLQVKLRRAEMDIAGEMNFP